MDIATFISVIPSFLVSAISKIIPSTIRELVHISLITFLKIELRCGGIIVVGEPGFVSFNSSILNGCLKYKARPVHLTNHVHSGFGEDPVLILLPGNDWKLRGVERGGLLEQSIILGLNNSDSFEQLRFLLIQLSNSFLDPDLLSFCHTQHLVPLSKKGSICQL